MKKLPVLFERTFEDHKPVCINDIPVKDMDWVLNGDGIATIKIDGSCCAIINGVFYRRYDAKRGKTPPQGAIPCCDPDTTTGHWPHWVPVSDTLKSDRWYMEAYQNTNGYELSDGTYEAVGPHFQNNPYQLSSDRLVRHGSQIVRDFPRDFSGIHQWLAMHNVEGIVFWKNNEPQCKIRRKDFSLKWPAEGRQIEYSPGSEILKP